MGYRRDDCKPYEPAIAVLREWAAARRRTIDAKRERNAYRCEHLPEESLWGEACWRSDIERRDWCRECTQRQVWHDRYRDAATNKGALTRKLVRIAERLPDGH